MTADLKDGILEEMLEIVGSLKGYLAEAKNSDRRSREILSLRKNPDRRMGRDKSAIGTISSRDRLEELKGQLEGCSRCPLSSSRRNIVFGEGNPEARLMFVGEGPGEEEDRQGRPFVGRAGQLLTKIIMAMGLTRDSVYIANIVKCRPPANRTPKPQEAQACTPFLNRQIEIIRPAFICALGSVAARFFLDTEAPISALRGKFYSYHGTELMATYHPAYLLRNPDAKKQVWEDVQQIMKRFA